VLKNKSNSTQRDGLVSRFKHYYRQIKNWVIHKPQLPGEIEKQMSMKAKISLSILAALILFAPMVSLSLHYLNSMWNRIQEIAVKDARLVDITQEIEVYMLLARRAESHLTLNAVPENDSIYIEQNTSATINFISQNLSRNGSHRNPAMIINNCRVMLLPGKRTSCCKTILNSLIRRFMRRIRIEPILW